MFFSVIVPIYNAEDTIENCLESVRNQTFKDFEVIMVNDGSKDSSEKICKKYESIDKRFRYLFQENKGVSVARNVGIKESKGEYLTFVDSDDFYYRTFLESFYSLINKYPEKGHYWCTYQVFESNQITDKRLKPVDQNDNVSLTDCTHIMDLHKRVLDGPPWNKVYKRGTVENLLFAPDLSLGEDKLFNWMYLDRSSNREIVINECPQYGYNNKSENSLTKRYYPNYEEICNLMLDTMKKYLIKWDVSEDQWIIYYDTAYYMYEQTLINNMKNGSIKGKRDKYLNNNRIIRSKKFKEALKNCNCRINPLYRMAYRLNSYRLIVLANSLLRILRNGREFISCQRIEKS